MEADVPPQPEKQLILMRGLPGSGKSTKARKIAGEKGVVFSTDDFFMANGQYVYDPKMIGEYHSRNFERTFAALKEGKSPIIVDNTNIKLWEMKQYVLAGEEHGYAVRIEEPETPWAFNYRQCAKRNSHNVPEETCRKMLDNYEPCKSVEEVKAAKSFKDKKKQFG
jgi:predicted kinase